ncbi:Carbon monoxide dehydrogenase small chain [subsurface metagenome]
MSRHRISVRANGQLYEREVEGRRTLLQFIREDLGLTGTKCACERGDCGLCTVLIDGTPTKSCLVLAVEVDGKEITTIEGLMEGEELNRVQRAFIEHGAVQCGFCTSAFILAGEALLKRNPNPTEDEIKEAVGGILCRCTGYRQIIDAILDAAKGAKK